MLTLQFCLHYEKNTHDGFTVSFFVKDKVRLFRGDTWCKNNESSIMLTVHFCQHYVKNIRNGFIISIKKIKFHGLSAIV